MQQIHISKLYCLDSGNGAIGYEKDANQTQLASPFKRTYLVVYTSDDRIGIVPLTKSKTNDGKFKYRRNSIEILQKEAKIKHDSLADNEHYNELTIEEFLKRNPTLIENTNEECLLERARECRIEIDKIISPDKKISFE